MHGYVELVRELKALRKGRGVLAGQIDKRVGPALRSACGITDRDGPVAVRRKVQGRLVELIGRLPDDLGELTRVAFAIGSASRMPLYQDRVRWMADELDRESRTVRRRVDEAVHQLAELIADTAAEGPGDGPGWHTAELRVVVALDLPEVIEQRRVVADADGVRLVDLGPPLSPDVRVLYGGTLVDQHRAVELPAPVPRGEERDFAIGYRLPPDHAVRSYLMTPPRRSCDLFDLRVRFGPDRVPPRVWTVSGADRAYRGEPHPLDQAGEIHVRFRSLFPGLAYGARWDAGCACGR
ncbi:hypothetical protein ACFQV2_14095 [Actinokineospora soli]|uniref:Uncharacterized protein n=1 Tax=Actinokineospora soli TaxID=1048753 RepID=A0ABW2TN70_9PSEU